MKRLKIIGNVAFILLGFAAVAFASEHGEAHEGLNWTDFMYRTINFVLVAGVLYKLAGKKFADFFRGRRTQIENQLSDLESRKIEAGKNLSQIEKDIANLASEKTRILDEYKAQGEAQKQAIIKAAEESAKQIRTQAKMTAENEVKASIDAVRSEMAELVVAAAEKLVREKLTAEEQEKLVDEYLTKVVLN